MTTFLMGGCGQNSGNLNERGKNSPQIYDLEFKPKRIRQNDVDDISRINASVMVLDLDGDADLIRVTAEGQSTDFKISDSHGATEGIVGFYLFVNTKEIGKYEFTVEAYDDQRYKSNPLKGIYEIY
ncbi:MAG: hypothetical protein ACW98X_24545 [Promethearchaeota archaeon]